MKAQVARRNATIEDLHNELAAVKKTAEMLPALQQSLEEEKAKRAAAEQQIGAFQSKIRRTEIFNVLLQHESSQMRSRLTEIIGNHFTDATKAQEALTNANPTLEYEKMEKEQLVAYVQELSKQLDFTRNEKLAILAEIPTDRVPAILRDATALAIDVTKGQTPAEVSRRSAEMKMNDEKAKQFHEHRRINTWLCDGVNSKSVPWQHSGMSAEASMVPSATGTLTADATKEVGASAAAVEPSMVPSATAAAPSKEVEASMVPSATGTLTAAPPKEVEPSMVPSATGTSAAAPSKEVEASATAMEISSAQAISKEKPAAAKATSKETSAPSLISKEGSDGMDISPPRPTTADKARSVLGIMEKSKAHKAKTDLQKASETSTASDHMAKKARVDTSAAPATTHPPPEPETVIADTPDATNILDEFADLFGDSPPDA